MRKALAPTLVAGALVFTPASAIADSGCQSRSCLERVERKAAAKARASCRATSCRRRVARREVRQKWKRAVDAYGRGTLAARAACEGSSNYAMRKANGFWFVFQFEARAWAGAGGRIAGEPVGAWSYQPTRLELEYRAVRWHRVHGGDPWPHCP